MSRINLWLMRIIGGFNIAYCICGILFYCAELHPYHGRWPGSPTERDWVAFVILSAVSLCFDIFLAFMGAQLLLRAQIAAARRTLWTLLGEIAYLLVSIEILWVVLGRHLNPDLTAGFFSTALFPLAPQEVTGYPVFGSLILWFILHKAHKQRLAKSIGNDGSESAV